MQCRVSVICALLIGALAVPSHSQNSSVAELLANADPATQTNWAERYEHGEGVERNYDHAVQPYCSAGRDGNIDAQYQLCWLYANGRGMERNDELAASQGDAHSSRMLA